MATGCKISSALMLIGLMGTVLTEEAPKTSDNAYKTQPSSTSLVLRSSGYRAEDHYIPVQNGQYTLNLVRATNPLISNGTSGLVHNEPILFIHGMSTNANVFIFNNKEVKPKNYSNHDISSMGDNELQELLKQDPCSHSLVFTALNFGYEVWLLNRRAAADLRREPHNYWNFSLDEQATYDLPATIDYVLTKSNKGKLITVSYAAGSTITMMSLADKPDMAFKISKAILWAPSFDFGRGYLGRVLDKAIVGSLAKISRTTGRFPSGALTPSEVVAYVACNNELLRRYLCDPVVEILFGKGADELESDYTAYRNDWFGRNSHFELAQFGQALKKGRMYHFDYMNSTLNMAAYGKPEPPIYDISQIKLRKMSIWLGNTDKLASVANFELTKKRLTVPIDKRIIGGKKYSFNHFGFMSHKNVAELLIIPSLKSIGSD